MRLQIRFGRIIDRIAGELLVLLERAIERFAALDLTMSNNVPGRPVIFCRASVRDFQASESLQKERQLKNFQLEIRLASSRISF